MTDETDLLNRLIDLYNSQIDRDRREKKKEPPWQETDAALDRIVKRSERSRKEIESLPIRIRDDAIEKTIRPFLREGDGITERTIAEQGERLLRRLTKEYFLRQGYECYTDQELEQSRWHKRRSWTGKWAKEDYPIPDVFAKKPTEIVIAEVKKDTSAKSYDDCIHKLTECSKFANLVYAVFPLPSRLSKRMLNGVERKVRRLKEAVPDAGLLLVNRRRKKKEAVYEWCPAKKHDISDTNKNWALHNLFDLLGARARVLSHKYGT